jgi:hypothetical protein
MIKLDDSSETNDLIHKEEVDIYKVYSIKNVKSYTHSDLTVWSVETTPISDPGVQNMYFAFDTIYENAFGHWVFECAIYLPLYKLLRARIPNLKLYLKSAKTYKTLFCKYFDIHKDDVVYEFDVAHQSVCYFPSPISALNVPCLHTDYVKHLDLFWDNFRLFNARNHHEVDLNVCGHTGIDAVESHVVTVLPRQKKENYNSNDREVPFNKIIEYVTTIPDHVLLHTDAVEDLQHQIEVLRKSKIIVLTDGAAFHVNGMFCYNKNIIVSGPLFSKTQGCTFHKSGYIIEKIIRQNKSVLFISEEDSACKQIELFSNAA